MTGVAPAGVEDAEVARRGLLLVLSAPSGAGKSTIARALLAADPGLRLSVSVTTRPPRPGERDGVDYHFVDDGVFARMIADGALLEHATVFAHGYGTPRLAVEAALAAGRDILFDIDWQGARQLRQAAPADVVGVFILPPSRAELERRLRHRAQDTDAVVARRMAKAADEMSHWVDYDYVIVNRDLARAVAEVGAVLAAERRRRQRQVGLDGFVRAVCRT